MKKGINTFLGLLLVCALLFGLTHTLMLGAGEGDKVSSKGNAEKAGSKTSGEKDNPTSSLTVNQIVERVVKTYNECESYRDSGTARIVMVATAAKPGSRKPRNTETESSFTTAFIRPDKFNFEFTTKGILGMQDRGVVWANGNKVRSWSTLHLGIESGTTLSGPLGGASPLSNGASHTIPTLLFAEQEQIAIGGKTALAKKIPWIQSGSDKLKRLKDASFGMKECIVLAGSLHQKDSDVTVIWIDKSNFTILKVEEMNYFDDFKSQTTRVYEPVLNEKIEGKYFEFKEPKSD